MLRKPKVPMLTEALHRKAVLLGIPVNGTFELTPVCNMNCKMCYVRMSEEKQKAIQPLKSAEEWLELGRRAKEKGTLYLLLTGGEPFTHPQIKEIIEGLHNMGFIISINTNATLIDEDVVEWLKKCPPAKINITMYGASNETYKRLCQNPYGYDQVTRAIRLLKSNGFNVKINFSGTPANIDDMEKVFLFCEDNGLIVQTSTYMFPPIRKSPDHIGHNFRFTPETAAYYSAKADCLFLGKELFTERYKANSLSGIDNKAEDDCIKLEGDSSKCRAGRCSYWITWKGEMLPCGMFGSDPHYLNVFENDFDECWNSVTDFIRGIRLPAKCAGCNLKDKCKACAAMVYTETGTFDQVPVYRCDMAHAYHAQCKKIIEDTQ